MILQDVVYSIVTKDGINYAYAVDLFGNIFQFQDEEEAQKELRAYSMMSGEEAWILKVTKELLPKN